MIHVPFTELGNFPKRSLSDFLKVVRLMAKVPNITWPGYSEGKENSPSAWKEWPKTKERGNAWFLYCYNKTASQITYSKHYLTWIFRRRRKFKKEEMRAFCNATTKQFQRCLLLQDSIIFNGCCLHLVSLTKRNSLVILEHWQKQFSSLFQRQTFQQ